MSKETKRLIKVDTLSRYDLEGKVSAIILRLESVIEEHGSDAEIDIYAQEVYGSIEMEVKINRPESDAERRVRLAMERNSAEQMRERRRQEFEKLKKEFEGK